MAPPRETLPAPNFSCTLDFACPQQTSLCVAAISDPAHPQHSGPPSSGDGCRCRCHGLDDTHAHGHALAPRRLTPDASAPALFALVKQHVERQRPFVETLLLCLSSRSRWPVCWREPPSSGATLPAPSLAPPVAHASPPLVIAACSPPKPTRPPNFSRHTGRASTQLAEHTSTTTSHPRALHASDSRAPDAPHCPGRL